MAKLTSYKIGWTVAAHHTNRESDQTPQRQKLGHIYTHASSFARYDLVRGKHPKQKQNSHENRSQHRQKLARRSIEPTACSGRSLPPIKSVQEQGKTQLYLGGLTRRRRGSDPPSPLLLESSGDASLRARRDKWEREPPAARAGSLFIRARLVGLVCRCWNRVFGCSLQGGERRWEAAMSVCQRSRSRSGDRASQRPLASPGPGQWRRSGRPMGLIIAGGRRPRGRGGAFGAETGARPRRMTGRLGRVGHGRRPWSVWAGWPATEPSSTKLAHEEEEGSRNQPKTTRKLRKANGFVLLAQRLQARHRLSWADGLYDV